jgi:serine/threonine-protein kinase RsbW
MDHAGGLGDGVPGEVLEDSAEELYEHAPCGYLSTLPRGEIVKVNETFLRWTGYGREELVGRRRFQDLLTGGGRIYHETHYAPLLRMQDEVHEIALEVVCASGERLPVLVNSVLKRDAEGRPLLIRTTVFNAVERRRYERELLLARDAERAARERIARLQRLTAALAAPLDRDGIAAAVIEEIVAETGAEEVAVTLVDRERGGLGVVGERGGRAPAGDDWDGAAAAVLQAGEAVFLEHDDVGAVALLPLLRDGRAIGVLRYGFLAPRRFAEEERAFARAVAAQAAMAFERARLLAETERAARRAAYVGDVMRALYEVAGVAQRVERLLAMIVPRLADAAAVEPDDRDEVPEVVTRARRTGRPALEERSHDGGSSVALPLHALGHRFGVLALRQGPGARNLGTADLPFLTDFADRAALALENARLYEQQRDVAEILQRSMLPGAMPRDERFELVTYYRPAVEGLEVGGDWYDCVPIGEGRIGIAVGDVVGRGIVAASAMGQLRSAVRALARADLGPARVLEQLDAFVAELPAGRYATIAYAELDLDTGVMTYACAGHPPPLLLPEAGPPALLWDGRSPPLGASTPELPRTEAALALPRDARLLLYTDGLVERRRRSMDLGIERLAHESALRRDAPLPRLALSLTDAMLDDFDGDDDVCLLCLRYHGAAPTPAVTGHGGSAASSAGRPD